MNPADLTLGISPTLTTRTLAQSATTTAALGLVRIPILRVDLEPIYLQIKTALGDHWNDYKTALNHFVLGHLSQVELAWVLQPILTPIISTSTAAAVATDATTTANGVPNPTAPSPLHLHNTLLAAIYSNTLRDPPPSEVAPWVVATDKPTSGAKNAGASGANDKADERLKREVMAMPARDRRRVKALKESGRSVNDGFAEAHAYRHELASRPPDASTLPTGGGAGAGAGAGGTGGGGGGGSARTNWDLEMRRRYAQPLAHETLEFPTQTDLQNRIEPLCFEEGVSGGVSASVLPACAELLEQATEVYLKEMLGAMCAHSRANDEGCIQTRAFRRQFRREEADAERGTVQRSVAGLLPVELNARAKRTPLGIEDLRLAIELKDSFFRHNRFLAASLAVPRRCEPEPTQAMMQGMVNGGSFSGNGNGNGGGGAKRPMANGFGGKYERGESIVPASVVDAAATAAADWSWRGGGKADTDDLLGSLDECLAFG